MTLLEKIIHKTRVSLFPSLHDIEIKKWEKNGGDKTHRYSFNLNSDSIVFDLGGYKGQWASDIYSRYLCKILVFEPVKEFAKNIEQRFIRNNNIKVFDFALGSHNREEIISMDADGSSTFGKSGIKELVQFKDISSFIGDENIIKIDLMKINIEGGEYEVLTKLIENGDIKKISQLQIQFHNISNNSLNQMNEIKKNLRKTHNSTFEYIFVWENWVLI